LAFAFLFGLSMDHEVFMLSRIREAYDETGDTPGGDRTRARPHGQARHERRVILMFAFFVLSSSPSVDVKQFGIGLAGRIIFDATVIPGAARPLADASARTLELVASGARRAPVAARARPVFPLSPAP